MSSARAWLAAGCLLVLLVSIAWQINSSANRILTAMEAKQEAPEGWEPRVIKSVVNGSDVITPEEFGSTLEEWKEKHLEGMRLAQDPAIDETRKGDRDDG